MLPALLLLSAGPADLIVTNARIWTDGSMTPHTALAIKDGRIVHLGGADRSLIGPSTQTVDAGGRVVIPGMIDAHTHMMEAGVGLIRYLSLREANSRADFVKRIEEWSTKLPKDAWVIGTSWSAESWPEKSDPTRYWIDKATGDRPAILRRMDGHSLLVNTKALERFKITKDTPNPPGGVIDKDPVTGEPTGMLRETAMGLVSTPGITPEEQYQGFLASVAEANRFGVTAASDIASTSQAVHFRRYANSKNPTFRIGLYARTANFEQTIKSVKGIQSVPGWFEPKGLKVYMDGSLGSRTAYMLAPFNAPLKGQPSDWKGVPMPGAVDGSYEKGMRLAADANLQVIVHAIGDRANRDVLDMFSQVSGINRRRFRVEHVQHLHPQDVPRFRRMGVIASMQPYHKADDGRYCEEVIGEDRCRTSYAFRDLLRTGATVAFGSDFNVVTINPWEGIAAAVSGKILTGSVWMPHQNITVNEALTAYTRSSAQAMFMDSQIGSLKQGYLGDVVILDRDPFKPGEDLSKVRPWKLFVGGTQVRLQP